MSSHTFSGTWYDSGDTERAWWVKPDGTWMRIDGEHFSYILTQEEKDQIAEEMDSYYLKYYRKTGIVATQYFNGEVACKAMRRVMKEGWIRIRMYGSKSDPHWYIHGWRMRSSVKRGRLKMILNYLLDNYPSMAEPEDTVRVIQEDESYWGRGQRRGIEGIEKGTIWEILNGHW